MLRELRMGPAHLRRAANWPREEWTRLLRALVALLRFSLILRWQGAKTALAAARLTMIDAAGDTPTDAQSPEVPVEAFAIRTACERASRLLPWKPTCLAQCLARMQMMQAEGVSGTLKIGFARESGRGPLAGHAWLGGDPDDDARQYSVTAIFRPE